MEWISDFCNSFLFWAAWIIIPVIMEIIPSLGSVLVLIKKHIQKKPMEKPGIDPEISLIIPIYNSMDTLEPCLRSIDESDYPSDRIRIFLVNNQGQDDSFQVFCQCQRKYPGLRMQWLNAKQGKSKALNLALFNSEGKYIVHIDSDGVLEKSALKNMVYRFENDQSIECMTGVILTEPRLVQKYPLLFPRLLRKLEFVEYAQAFLAGRNYASELNAVYTLSGAFSAFRKSAVLKSQLYNTDTICEDTQITFQMKYLLNIKVGVCEDAIQLNTLLKTQQPDLLLLDIEMPYLSGLDLLATLNQPPKVIVTSAYEQYALKGYELDVVDYLLKPISFERFLKGVNKVHDLLARENTPDADASFFVKSEKQMRKIYLRDILFVEALENYVSIYTTSGRVLTHSTLKRIGESLPDDQFLQTHKSYIINADRVDLVEGNRLRIESYQIPIARNLRDVVFKRILKNTL